MTGPQLRDDRDPYSCEHQALRTSKARILSGSTNVQFSDMVNLVAGFGFRASRVEGSHHIFVHPDVAELVNLQEVGGQAKPYQIRQFLKLVEKYDLRLERR